MPGTTSEQPIDARLTAMDRALDAYRLALEDGDFHRAGDALVNLIRHASASHELVTKIHRATRPHP